MRAPALAVLALDAPPVVRAGVEAAVDAVPDLTLAAGGAPDVLVVEDPAAASEHPQARVLLLARDARQAAAAALAGGADGGVTYDVDLPELVAAIRAVGRGQAVYSAPVADAVVAALTESSPDTAAQAFPALTAREGEVLERLATGASNWDIGVALGLSTKTVRNHLSHIYVKLGVLDRAQAVLVARDAGLGHPGDRPAPLGAASTSGSA
jgi:DNA-binding NarL/FixJ family response regulator